MTRQKAKAWALILSLYAVPLALAYLFDYVHPLAWLGAQIGNAAPALPPGEAAFIAALDDFETFSGAPSRGTTGQSIARRDPGLACRLAVPARDWVGRLMPVINFGDHRGVSVAISKHHALISYAMGHFAGGDPINAEAFRLRFYANDAAVTAALALRPTSWVRFSGSFVMEDGCPQEDHREHDGLDAMPSDFLFQLDALEPAE